MLAPALPSSDSLVEGILHQPPALVLLVVFLLPALEASIMVGVVFPGEIAVLLGGVAAHEGDTPLAAVIAAAIAGAVIGDAIGFGVGRRWGPALIARLPQRLLPPHHVEAGLDALRRLGWRAVILGRWTALLRAVVPGLAGMSRMPTRTFLTANVVGGALWASAVAVAGFLAGASWRKVQSAVGTASYAIAGVVVVAIVVVVLVRRRRRRGAERRLSAEQPS